MNPKSTPSILYEFADVVCFYMGFSKTAHTQFFAIYGKWLWKFFSSKFWLRKIRILRTFATFRIDVKKNFFWEKNSAFFSKSRFKMLSIIRILRVVGGGTVGGWTGSYRLVVCLQNTTLGNLNTQTLQILEYCQEKYLYSNFAYLIISGFFSS